ncbi:MAG: RsmD family RNA methyltransferase [Candidatus Altarchaeaceae archaeon]
MKIKTVIEGKGKILIPDTEKISSKFPFYNPAMNINRNFTLAIIRIFNCENFLDGLSACGALSIRALKETNANIYACENNPESYKILEENVKMNCEDDEERKRIRTYKTDLNLLLNLLRKQKIKFDFIDIDPFGSPVEFLDNVFINSKHNTIIGVTATDLGTLCGKYENTCLRRYQCYSYNVDFDKEFGLRNLISYIARSAGKFEIGIEILFSYYYLHYFKVYFRIKKLRSFSDKTLENVKFLKYCPNCLNREYIDENFDNICENCKTKTKILGPLWTGKFADENVCEMLKNDLEKNEERKEIIKKELKILDLVKNEQKINLPYYNIHKICKIHKLKIPKKEEILKINQDKFRETHFTGTGIKFDGNVKELKEIFESIII